MKIYKFNVIALFLFFGTFSPGETDSPLAYNQYIKNRQPSLANFYGESIAAMDIDEQNRFLTAAVETFEWATLMFGIEPEKFSGGYGLFFAVISTQYDTGNGVMPAVEIPEEMIKSMEDWPDDLRAAFTNYLMSSSASIRFWMNPPGMAYPFPRQMQGGTLVRDPIANLTVLGMSQEEIDNVKTAPSTVQALENLLDKVKKMDNSGDYGKSLPESLVQYRNTVLRFPQWNLLDAIHQYARAQGDDWITAPGRKMSEKLKGDDVWAGFRKSENSSGQDGTSESANRKIDLKALLPIPKEVLEEVFAGRIFIGRKGAVPINVFEETLRYFEEVSKTDGLHQDVKYLLYVQIVEMSHDYAIHGPENSKDPHLLALANYYADLLHTNPENYIFKGRTLGTGTFEGLLALEKRIKAVVDGAQPNNFPYDFLFMLYGHRNEALEKGMDEEAARSQALKYLNYSKPLIPKDSPETIPEASKILYRIRDRILLICENDKGLEKLIWFIEHGPDDPKLQHRARSSLNRRKR